MTVGVLMSMWLPHPIVLEPNDGFSTSTRHHPMFELLDFLPSIMNCNLTAIKICGSNTNAIMGICCFM
jgi:hypothetical protein